jgi:TorA-specific chaperone
MADAATLSDTPTDVERAAAYRWLAALFAGEPSAETLAIYASPDGAALLDDLATLPALAPAAGTLAALAADPDRRSRALDLAGAFARLFHGVGGRRAAPPCASVWLSERGTMWQEQAGAAADDLARLDLRLADQFREPPDHVSVQLSAMATLIERGDAAAQTALLERRLLSWIGAFRDACVAGDRHGFYAAAAQGLVGFCEADRSLLAGRA